MGQPEKAYKNLEFLNSAEARMLRILSEYLEPRVRFQKQDVENTIVFFGSARLIDRETANAQVQACQRQVSHSPSPEYQHALREAEHRLKLSRYYEDARMLAKLLTEWSHQEKNRKRGYLIASGGGPGIMEAANRGASEVPGGRSVGLNISIPMEQGSNPYITDELNFEFHYFFTRKFWFVYLAKALVVFPGGFGTLDELFEVLTLIQTRKVEKPLPVVLYGADYWRQLINFDFLVDNLMIHPEDMNLLYFADTPEEAFQYLNQRLKSHT